MKKSNKQALLIMGFALAAGIGAGSVYLANMNKIKFMDKYPMLLEIEKFAHEGLELGDPEPSDEQVINAYLSLYGDKYTYYKKTDINTPEFAALEVNNSPLSYGSGLKIDFNDEGEPYFSDITPDMPADKQGIREKDKIISIDGNKISTYRDVKKIRGEEGSTVKLVLERDGKEIEIDFKRHNDSLESAGVTYEKYGDTLCITFPEMSTQSTGAFQEALDENEFDSLIIDLRNNGGGDAAIALSIADIFIDKADLIMRYNNGSEERRSTTDGVQYDVPIVLLVNDKTASSAEILTAFLRQYADTTIVGTTTFGKGIFQSSAMFYSGSLSYTDGTFTVGDWESWHGKGITPDVEVDMDKELIGTTEDIQLQKAIELLD